MQMSPTSMLIIGFLCVSYGMIVPFLMVMRFVEPTFFLSITSYGATFTGVMLGVVGVATYSRQRRNRDRK